MKSTGLKNRAWQLAAMFMVLIAGLSFMSCASDSGEDEEASPIVGTWQSQASSKGTYYMQFTEYKQYFFTNPRRAPGRAAETASAAATSTASIVVVSTSP